MKKYLVLAVLLAVVALMTAGTAAAAVIGTKHDMTAFTGATFTQGGSTTVSEVCVYCHTPHAASTVITTLLWNKTAVSTLPYSPYANNGSIQGTISPTMGAQTRICLSCHDGSTSVFNMVNPPNSGGYVTALGAAVGGVGTTGIIQPGASSLIDRNFQNDHPVSIQWPAAGSDPGIGATPPAWAQLFGTPLQMECGTCHDVHDNTNAPFLRRSNTRSGMCLSCHTDK
jgi:predicted CXXCH cytochrome family protein